MTAQVVLLIAGLAFIFLAILGSVESIQVKVTTVPLWGRILLAAVGVVVFALAFTPLVSDNLSAGTVQPSAASASQASTLPTPLPTPSSAGTLFGSTANARATLVSPTDGVKVSKSQGFIATGTATEMGLDSVWLLDYDSGYFIDGKAKIAGGHWSATDAPIGDPSNHLPFDETVRVVVAQPLCAYKLRQVGQTSNDYIARLPHGCSVIGEVTVNVTSP